MAKSTASPRSSAKALETLNRKYGLVSDTAVVPPTRSGAGKAIPGSGRLEDFRVRSWRKIVFSSDADPWVVAAEYKSLDIVEAAQPNYLATLAGQPSDPLFADQWNLADFGYGPRSEGPRRRSDTAEVLVAVIDSGMDYRHPDIVEQLWSNGAEAEGRDRVDDDGNGYVDDILGWDFADAPSLPGDGDYLNPDADPMDESGHGTHVGGIIAAGVDNAIGVAGVATDVRLMVLRAAFNVGGTSYLENDAIAAAIIYAVDNGAQVLNFSFGSPQFSPLIRDAVRYADAAGLVMIAAAGNEGNEAVFHPARHEECIAVAASGVDGGIPSFSNFGYSIDVAAPGEHISSLAPGELYVVLSGTSMAAAHVSGLAAQWLSYFPHLTPLQIRGALSTSARDVAPPGWDERSGAGIARSPDVYDASPLAARIESAEPNTGDAVESRVVRLSLTGSGRISYELSWGAGVAPGTWTVLTSGDTVVEPAGVSESVDVSWETDALAHGLYLLRAVVKSGARRHEDRFAVNLPQRAPVIERLTWLKALNGPEWDYLVEWATREPAVGTLHVFSEGEDDPTYQLPVEALRSRQSVALPADLPSGQYRVDVRLGRNSAATAGTLSVPVAPRGVIGWNFELFADLPDGFLMPQPADFDGDGRVEVVEMISAGGRYNTSDFFEFDADGSFDTRPVHTSARLFIPWSHHDLDGDGKREVMAVDAQRVRLVESSETGRFPDRAIWEQRDVWGGETADLDADGKSEMYLRSSRARQFRVFEAVGDDTFIETTVLVNPWPGSGEFGDRQIVADLDGDGRGELLTGDGDGNLFVYENVADDVFRLVWSDVADQGQSRGDRRLLGGAADLDADGKQEFVSCELDLDLFELDQSRWHVRVFEAAGDDEFAVEWDAVVLNGKAAANGVGLGDFNGDGRVEFVASLVPDLYVFQHSATEGYEPVWHFPVGDAHRPFSGDLNGDGTDELAFNSGGQVQVYSLQRQKSVVLKAPGRFRGVPLGEDSALLEWEAVDGAAAYRVYRGLDGDGVLHATVEAGTQFTDVDVQEGETYRYWVTGVDSIGGEGYRTPQVVVALEPKPALVDVGRISRRQLSLTFDRSMGRSVEDIYRYRVEPGVGAPSSALLIQGGRRVVLSFVEDLPDSGTFVLHAQDLRSLRGTPLPFLADGLEFALRAIASSARVLGAEAITATRVSVWFDRPVELQADSTSPAFVVDEGRIRILHAFAGSHDAEILLELDPATPLRSVGRRYRIEIVSLRDESGQSIEGSTFVHLEAVDLSSVTVFPNPFDPTRGELTFGNLPVHTQVHIADLGGHVLRVLEERSGDGGVNWDGSNAAGRPVAGGIYFFQLIHHNDARTGKLAVVRSRQ